MLAEGLGGLAERDGGNREIVHQLRVAAERLAAMAQDVEEAAGAVAGEATAGEVHPLGEGVPGLLVRAGAELGERVVDVTAEVFVRHVAAAVAHEPPLPRQQAVLGQLVEAGRTIRLARSPVAPNKTKIVGPRPGLDLSFLFLAGMNPRYVTWY